MRKEARQTLWIVGGTVIAFALLAIFIPNLDGPRKRQRANEYAAVTRLRKLNKLQAQYAAAHKDSGYACRLSDLAALDHELVLRSFYDDGRVNGYAFSLAGCSDAKPNRHYSIVGVPIVAEYFGTKSFCTNESGVVFRDDDTAGIHCLSNGKPLN
jgi:hypothetical protein